MLIRSLDGINPLDDIIEYSEVELVQRDLDSGYWSITLPARGLDAPAYRWLNAPNPGIEVFDPNTEFRFGGPARKATRRHDRNRTTVTISGVDFQALLGSRLAWPNPQNLSDWWKSQDPEGETRYPDPPLTRSMPLTSAAFWLVDQNMGPSALLQRQLASLTYGPDFAAGGTKSFKSVGEPLLAVLREWFTDSPFGAGLRFKRDQVGAGTPGTLLFECGARPYSQFALTDATVDEWVVEDTAAEGTWVLAMGGTDKDRIELERAALGLGEDDSDPTMRFLTELADPLVDQTWLRPYNEVFLNRSSLAFDLVTGGPLIEAATDELRRKGPKRSLHIPDVTVETFGQDLHIGWLVPTAVLSESVGAVAPVWNHLPVSRFRYHQDENGELRTIDVGEKLGSPADGIFDSINQVADAVKTLNLMSPRNV